MISSNATDRLQRLQKRRLLLVEDGSLLGATALEGTVLALLNLLPGGRHLGLEASLDQAMLGLELLHSLNAVVDESESAGLAATEVGAEAEQGDLVVVPDVVHLGDLLLELSLGDVGTARVQDVHHELAAAQQPVGHELAGPDGDGLLAHGDWMLLRSDRVL